MLVAASALTSCTAEELRTQLQAVQQELARRGLYQSTSSHDRPEENQLQLDTDRTLHLLISAAPLPIVCADEEGRVTEWNPAAEALFGWSATEVLGRKLPYVPASEEPAADALFQQGMSGSVRGPLHIRRCRKDGTLLDLRLWPACIRDQHGRFLLTFGIYEDITDYRRAEAALKESEQRYHSLYHNNPSMYFTLSPGGLVLSVNRFGAEQLGYEECELLGQSILVVFDPAEHPTVLSQLAICAAAPGETFKWEIRKVRKDGSQLWVKERARAVADDQGRQTILVVCEDVTDRKHAEAVLQDNERRLRLILDNEPECVKTVSLDGLLQTMNPAGLAMVDAQSEDEIRGLPMRHLIHPNDWQAYERFHKSVSSGQTASLSFRMHGLRGTERVVESHAVPLKDQDGTVTAVLSVTRDMTERRHAAEERERFSQDLHDNILQSLYAIGMQLEASKLTLARAPRKSKAYTSQAIDHLNRLVREVRQFIALLRQERTASLDFGQALLHLAASFSLPTGETALELDINDDAIGVITPEQGEQLLNIAREALSNSMRHAHATRRWLQLSRTETAVRMHMCDDGIGFDPKAKRRAGHGLAHMAARAKRIKARFSLKSSSGQGTCITVDLPINRV